MSEIWQTPASAVKWKGVCSSWQTEMGMPHCGHNECS